MYHCSSMPMSAHIASGLFGAVVIDPPGLPAVDRSFVLVQSELYLGAQGRTLELDALEDERADGVVVNGMPTSTTTSRCASAPASGCASGCWTPAPTA